jgi:DNA polymerase elongation subunit (family B)
VFDGPEKQLLIDLDNAIAELSPGVLVTWNGARFDLPFLADRARTAGVTLGLDLTADDRTRSRREPLPGHTGGYLGRWYTHQHLDAYAVYRADVGASLRLPCGLKPLARMLGLTPVEVDRTEIHELTPTQLSEYVASDAILTRELALRRWPTASRAIDRLR